MVGDAKVLYCESELSTFMDKTVQFNGFIKKELLILAPFVKTPWASFTLTEIKMLTRNKSHHYVFEALEKFCFLGALKKIIRGNTNVYSVKGGIEYFSLVEVLMKEKARLPFKNLDLIAEKIKSPYYTLIVGGSYAAGNPKAGSDLDVVVIIPDADKKPFQVALREGELMIPEVHGFVFTYPEFYSMLVNDEFNLGKEFARKHVIVYGAEAYYKILFEAMKHGFKG